jgi:hypothetical protein
MANLNVDPRDLEDLAKKQDDAATEAGGAATAHAGLSTNCWVTHGVISGPSNAVLNSVEEARKAAGTTIANAAGDLAGKLRTAKQVYGGVDEDLGGNIDSQVLSR